MNALPRCAAVVLSVSSLFASAAQAGGPVGGHYYLQGVTEVGSELRLRDDGRFEWFLAYGAMDQTARGRWSERDGRVVLTTERPAPDGDPFRLDAVFAWDAQTEERMRDMEAARAGDLAQERCPFLAVADGVSAPPMIGGPEPSPDALAQAARDSLPPVTSARVVFEATAASALAARAYVVSVMGDEKLQRDADDAMRLAVAAMEAYRANLAQARDAHFAAGLDLPDLPEPRIPAECGMPVATDAQAVADAQPGQGLGVVIGDPAAGLRFSGIRVEFEFSDGHREARVTNRGGWALLRPRAGATLRRVSLRDAGDGVSAGRFAGTIADTIEVDPAKGDVLAIAFDSARHSAPAFERMELRVDGDALIPTWPDGDERGRYVRE